MAMNHSRFTRLITALVSTLLAGLAVLAMIIVPALHSLPVLATHALGRIALLARDPLSLFILAVGLVAIIALLVYRPVFGKKESVLLPSLERLGPEQQTQAIEADRKKHRVFAVGTALCLVVALLVWRSVALKPNLLQESAQSRDALLAGFRTLAAGRDLTTATLDAPADIAEAERIVAGIDRHLDLYAPGISPGDRTQLLLCKGATYCLLNQLAEASDTAAAIGTVKPPWDVKVDAFKTLIAMKRKTGPIDTSTPEGRVCQAERFLDKGMREEASALLRPYVESVDRDRALRIPVEGRWLVTAIGLWAIAENELFHPKVAANVAADGIAFAIRLLDANDLALQERTAIELGQAQCEMELANAHQQLEQPTQEVEHRKAAGKLLESLLFQRKQKGLVVALLEQVTKLVECLRDHGSASAVREAAEWKVAICEQLDKNGVSGAAEHLKAAKAELLSILKPSRTTLKSSLDESIPAATPPG